MWYLDNTRIFVTDMSIDSKEIISKLNPLGGGSIFHYWGYEFEDIELKCFVVGYEDREDVRTMARDGSSHNLVASGNSQSQWNFSIPVYIESIKWVGVPIVCQTLKSGVLEDAQMWNATMSLYWDE